MKHHRRKKRRSRQRDAALLNQPHPPPSNPTADCYRIAGYVDGLIGAARPECDLLLPHYDSGLRWPDSNNPQPDDPRFDGGVRAGVTWDGTFWRDLGRYAASGPLFWSAYLKPGSGPGMGNGFWLNFGHGWSHLAHDDPSQMLSGAAPRLWYDAGSGVWKLVIEATMYVTGAVVPVWVGEKSVGNDPIGAYARTGGCDPTATLTVEAA